MVRTIAEFAPPDERILKGPAIQWAAPLQAEGHP